MKWSQLKKRIETTFADSVRGRVEVWNTRYHKAHDDAGEGYITIDGERVASFGEYTYFVRLYGEERRLLAESGSTGCGDAERAEGYDRVWDQAKKTTADRGVFAPWEFNQALFDYLGLSMADILSSDNPIIRALGMLDRRFGKRRLREYDVSAEHPRVQTLHQVRCEAEGLITDDTRRGP